MADVVRKSSGLDQSASAPPLAEELRMNAKALEALSVKDYAGVAEALGMKWRGYRPQEDLEQLMCAAIGKNSNGSFSELLSAISDQFIALPNRCWDFGSWSHALCHNFERYGRGERDVSILNNDRDLPIATRLVDAAVEECVASRREGCMSRIIAPIMS